MFNFQNEIILGKELNELNNNKPFYKFINRNKIHKGFTYKQGLNVDTLPFNPTDTCRQGGLYFTTKDNIFHFKKYGDYCCNIIIPDDAQCYVEKYAIKANKIIVESFREVHQMSEWFDEDFCISAVKQKWQAIKYVKVMTPNVCKQYVKIEGQTIYFTPQTDELCELAVTQNGMALKFINNKTNKINLIAVRENGLALQHVSVQTEEICMVAIEQNPDAYQYVYIQTNKLSCLAVQKDYTQLQHVYAKTHSVCKCAIQQNVKALIYMDQDEQTDELCDLAVRIDGLALQYIHNKNFHICNVAITQNRNALKYVSCKILLLLGIM